MGNLLISLKLSQATLQPVLERITHSHEFDILVGGQRFGGCSRSPPTTANQADTEQITPGNMHIAG